MISCDPLDWNFRTYSACGNGTLELDEECDLGALWASLQTALVPVHVCVVEAALGWSPATTG